ncbi:aldo/keto reductase [Amphibacillus cookii]|uniref:aldo/keto reductase n=1 Tax=Amphibacillus cookii TaxID=767787 RepID=UPI0030841BD5
MPDYTTDGTLRSIEGSMKRLKTDKLDVVFVHDISPDFYGDEWISKFDEARNGAFKALTDLRDEGVIKGWGIGVNTTEPIELLLGLEEVRPDICLSATQYTLLDHEKALEHVMPMAKEKGVGIVVGAPYSSGALLGGHSYNYGDIPQEVADQIKQLEEVAAKYDTTLKAAALQFSTAHPSVAAVIPGSTRPERIKNDLAGLKTPIPAEFWKELVEKNLISPLAPLPA